MNVLHAGLAIAGASAVLIPIIIHLLFRQRRRPIVWGAMRYLVEAFRRARRRMQIEQLILLAIRCAMVFLFGLALARLFWAGAAGAGGLFAGGSRTVYLLIDNGVTSGLVDDEATTDAPSALAKHKNTARSIIRALSPSDRVAVITLARPVDVPVDPPALDHRAVLDVVDSIESRDSPTEISDAILRLRESIDAQSDDPSPAIVYLLSDFRQGSADPASPLSEILSDFARPVSLLASPPASSQPVNVQITGVNPVRALAMSQSIDGSGQVRVTLQRTGEISDATVTSVRLESEAGEVTASGTVEWAPGQSEAGVDLRLDLRQFEPGVHALTASIDDDALTVDNERYAVIEVRESLHVGVIDQREFGQSIDLRDMSAGAWFRRALNPGAGSTMRVEDIDPSIIEPVSLRGLDAVIVCRPDLITENGWQAIADFVNGGGLLWLVPPAELDVALWTDQARQALGVSWIWAREVQSPDQPLTLAPDQPVSALLTMLQGELRDLVRPVLIERYLPIEEGLGAGDTALVIQSRDPGPTTTQPASGDESDEGAREAPRTWLAATSPDGASGLVVYLASAPNLAWSSLPAKPLMVALVHETIRQGLSMIRRRARFEPGEQPSLNLPSSVVSIQLIDHAGKPVSSNEEMSRYSIVHQSGIARPDRAITRAGLYAALNADGGRSAVVPVNINPASADVSTHAADDILSWLQRSGPWVWTDADDPATALRVDDSRAELSVILLILVLVLGVLETILGRRFSHAYKRDSVRGFESMAGLTPTLTAERSAAPTATTSATATLSPTAPPPPGQASSPAEGARP